MANGHLYDVLQHIRGLVRAGEDAHLSDGTLLEQFLTRRDEAAFETLLRRHGPMVLNVCRRLLPDPHDAEDAFQATFLVFVRRAASITRRELLGNWLYGVAYRTARAARTAAGRRRAKEAQAVPRQETPDEDAWQEVVPLLDQELSRLPDKYRIPVILCDLEGKTRREAARLLGLPEGTLSSRLARARALLARRLRGRGVTVTGGILIAALSRSAVTAALPPQLMSLTIKAGAGVLAGQVMAAGVISAQVAALSEGVLKTMFLTKLKMTTVVLLAGGVLALGMGQVVTHQLWAGDPEPRQPAQQARTAPPNQPQPGSEFTIFALKYLRAADLAGELTHLVRGNNSVRIVVDDRTNSLLLTGPSEEVEALLKTVRLAEQGAAAAKPKAVSVADLAERVQRLEQQFKGWDERLKKLEIAVRQLQNDRAVRQYLRPQTDYQIPYQFRSDGKSIGKVKEVPPTPSSDLSERVQKLERQLRQWEEKMREKELQPLLKK